MISAVRPVRPCARPMQAAASSCRTFARHRCSLTCKSSVHLCGRPAATQCPIGISSQSVGELRLCAPRSASWAASPLSLSNNRRSTLRENPGELIPYTCLLHEGACPESGCLRVLLYCLYYNKFSDDCQWGSRKAVGHGTAFCSAPTVCRCAAGGRRFALCVESA